MAEQQRCHRVEIANVRSGEVVPPISVGTVSGCDVFETLQIAGVGQEIQVDHAYGRCTPEHPANEVRADEPGATGNQYARRRERHVRAGSYGGKSSRSSVSGRYSLSLSDRIGSRTGQGMPIVRTLHSTPCWSSGM